MTDQPNPRRPKRGTCHPQPETVALLKASGNAINGLGETAPRKPSPFFWHPPDQHPYAELQVVARQNSRKCPRSTAAFKAAYDYPALGPVAEAGTPLSSRNSPPKQPPSPYLMKPTGWVSLR